VAALKHGRPLLGPSGLGQVGAQGGPLARSLARALKSPVVASNCFRRHFRREDGRHSAALLEWGALFGRA